MDNSNRLFIALCASAWIVAMAVIIFLTWAAPDRTIDRLGDLVEFLDDNNTDAGKLVITLAALAAAIIGLLLIVVEIAPDDDPKELRIEQAGATMIVPADALRLRLEEALLAGIPEITAAHARVATRERGVAVDLGVTVTPSANVAHVTQEATHVVVEAINADLGLPVAGLPKVRIAFGGTRAVQAPASPIAAAAVTAEPAAANASISVLEANPAPPSLTTPDSAPAHADASPGPLVFDESTETPATPPLQKPPIEWPES